MTQALPDAATVTASVAHVHRPYLSYQDSGIQWLGAIPAHWRTRPLKYITRFSNGAPFKPSDWGAIGVPIIRIENLNGSDEFNYTTLNLGIEYQVASGDLLFAWSGNRGTSFGPFLWTRPGIFYLNQHIFKLNGFLIDRAWFYWALKAVTAYIESQAHGIIGLVHITKQSLGIIPVPDIPLDEQRSIASYLDRETARIDTLVAKKQRLIELLREKRTALISHAVTCGLDPNASLKDSGIDSVGLIPNHWQVRRNKQVFQEVDKRSTDSQEELLTVSHITGVTSRREKPDVNMFLAESTTGYKCCQPGDLVINTMWAWMGAVGIARQRGIVSPSYNVDRVREQRHDEYVPEYLDLLYRTPTYVCEMTRFSQGVWESRLRLYPEAFLELNTVTPPVEEQQAIVQYCAEQIERMQAFSRMLTRSIEKLKEYRAAVIAAAVTGKIDLREGVGSEMTYG